MHNIAKMKTDKKSILSEVYQDLETNVRIRTFSYPIQSSYLFLDLRID
ncbi:EAL-associated domain-containing protein [Domibacillus iocasae]